MDKIWNDSFTCSRTFWKVLWILSSRDSFTCSRIFWSSESCLLVDKAWNDSYMWSRTFQNYECYMWTRLAVIVSHAVGLYEEHSEICRYNLSDEWEWFTMIASHVLALLESNNSPAEVWQLWVWFLKEHFAAPHVLLVGILLNNRLIMLVLAQDR